MNLRNELEKLRNEVWHILQMDYSKRADFIPAILGGIDGILEMPKRNCDVGTAKEQQERLRESCKLYKAPLSQNRTCVGCPVYNEIVKAGKNVVCDLIWSQMPYESEVK